MDDGVMPKLILERDSAEHAVTHLQLNSGYASDTCSGTECYIAACLALVQVTAVLGEQLSNKPSCTSIYNVTWPRAIFKNSLFV